MADTFTPEQITQILEEFFKVVGTRKYIGERYVPIFGRKGEESIQWDNSAPYEPLTIVLYQGNSYTSRQYVPIGVDITNQEFWAITGNYNAQIELYHSETIAAQNDIDTLLPKADFSAENTVKKYIDENPTRILAFDTVADMQAATNLLVGMTCHTNGFHATGDGGAAYYKVSASGTANGMDVLALQGGLFATLVVTEPYVTPEQFGAYGNSTSDDTSVLTYVLSLAAKYKIVATNNYLISSSLSITINYTNFILTGSLTHTGSDYAVIVQASYCNLSFKNVVSSNGSGVCMSQVGLDYSKNVAYNSISIGFINAGTNGLAFIAGNHGVFNHNVTITGHIKAMQHAIYMYAGTSSASSAPSYCGEILIEGGRADGINGYGIYLDARDGYQITGVSINDTSIESSGSCICHAGGTIVSCVYNNLRFAEIRGNILEVTGNSRDCQFNNESPVVLTKIVNESTASIAKGFMLNCPIATSGGSVFGYKLRIAANTGVSCFKLNKDHAQGVSSNGYQWNTSKVPRTVFYANGTEGIIYLSDIPYFNEYAVDTIYIKSTSSNYIKILDNATDQNIIFDGSNYTSQGTAFHCIKCAEFTTDLNKYHVLY